MDTEIPEAKSFKLLTISAEKLPALMARQAEISSYATDRAKLLLGCYRTGDANDPETYVAAIAVTLARYPEEIITAVTHPVTGLPSQKNWLPTIKEVRDACQELQERLQAQIERERRIKEQLAARRQEELAAPRPTIAELKAKYGDDWGLNLHAAQHPPPAPAPTASQLREHYSKYGLQFKPKSLANAEVEAE